ncbi:MAG: glycosyltransferase family 2 protein [Magnetococcales bacterium]|nr:glycosyltransferase family 2 protein [Magnetococcales bacterium]
MSVTIPSYKAAHFDLCLQSAIRQTYRNIEILISDNCPTDDIKNIVDRYGDDRVSYRRSNASPLDNFLSSLFLGRGSLIKPLFDDDRLHETCIEKMVSVALQQGMLSQSNPRATLIFSASQVVDENDLALAERRIADRNCAIDQAAMVRKFITLDNQVGEFSTVMFARDELIRMSAYGLIRIGDNVLKGLGDVVFFTNLLQQGYAYYLNDILSFFRKSVTHSSNSNYQSNKDFIDEIVSWFDLYVSYYQEGLISRDELIATERRATMTYNYWKDRYGSDLTCMFNQYLDIIHFARNNTDDKLLAYVRQNVLPSAAMIAKSHSSTAMLWGTVKDLWRLLRS